MELAQPTTSADLIAFGRLVDDLRQRRLVGHISELAQALSLLAASTTFGKGHDSFANRQRCRIRRVPCLSKDEICRLEADPITAANVLNGALRPGRRHLISA